MRSSGIRRSARRIAASSTRVAADRARTRSRRRGSRGTRASSRRRSIASARPRAGCSRAPTWPRGRRRSSPSSTFDYRGLTVCKTQPWAAGPVGLQQLALLEGFDLAELSTAEFVHVVTECGKLAFADRDALYGDCEDVPLETSSFAEYNAERRALVGEDRRRRRTYPGRGRLPTVPDVAEVDGRLGGADAGRHGPPRRRRSFREPDLGDAERRVAAELPGDLLHSAGRSGRGRRCSGSRKGCASSLQPGARPRTTLSPGLALRDGEPYLAWGTPGGDQQEQWAIHVIPSSRRSRDEPAGGDRRARVPHRPPHLVVLPARALAEVARARVTVRFADGRRPCSAAATTSRSWPAWSAGRVTAVAREPDGLLRAGANPRGMQGYAVGR